LDEDGRDREEEDEGGGGEEDLKARSDNGTKFQPHGNTPARQVTVRIRHRPECGIKHLRHGKGGQKQGVPAPIPMPQQ
jgi:hypothetical protein